MKKLNRGIYAMPATKVFCRVLFLLAGSLIIGNCVKAQSGTTDSAGIKKILDKVEGYQKAFGTENVYLHLDKPYYAVGDTVWFKAYVLTGSSHTASTNSGKLYVELLNSSGKLVQRLTLPVASGLATGYFPLDAKTIPEDGYTLRAYTNWQQNFGAGSFFYRQLYVGKLGGKTWLVTEQNRNDNPADTNHVQLAMRFTDAKGLPLVTRPVTVRVMENGKPLLKSEMTTGVDGTLNGGFTLPAKANHRALSIAVEDVNDKGQHITFPFYPSGTNGDIDLQFMPEGGSLVAGLYNKMGFKAIGEDGLGREVKGTVVDSKGEEAATLQTLHNGMGSFVLVPQAGETYTAKLMINGKEKRYTLPKAKEQGIALRVDGVTHADELYVYITTAAADDKKYTLIAQSAGRVYFGSGFKFNTDNYFNTRIKKELFPTGIINLLILGPDNKPLNQRTVFVDHHDGMKITAMPGQASYTPKDSISLNLHVTDNVGNPVQANFSVAVTDDAQIKDAAQADNIQSHILLASELKGNIEGPAWYFNRDDKEDAKVKERALDNLLITQGWQGFDWEKLDATIPQPLFKPEPDISVSGKLTNFFNKPAAGLRVSLLANGKQMFLQDGASDKEGKFLFNNLPVTDTVAYLIKLHSKNGGTAAAGIAVDEFKPTGANLYGLLRPMPWNMNADTTLINYINKANQRSQAADVFLPPGSGKVLKQVDIKAQKVVKYVGNEFGTELMKMDEKDLIAEKKTSLFDLIYRKLPGFKTSNYYAINIYKKVEYHPDRMYVNGLLMVNDIMVDGQSIANPFALQQDVSLEVGGANAATPVKPGQANLSSQPSMQEVFDRMTDFLIALGADDVKSIGLYRGSQLFLAIETRSGKGPFTGVSRGTYVYRPPFIQLPRQFYSPKYLVKNTLPDLRSTIHWEPNLVTDASGNAKLLFYAADKPSTYTVVIEGTDMQGHFGVDTRKINVAQVSTEVK